MLKVNIQKSLGAFQIDASFESDASLLALFGPSGAGKSSILSMIAGLTEPDGGHVSLDDVDFYDGQAGTSLLTENRRLGFVFQDPLLFPHMNVDRNMRYARWAGGRDGSLDFDNVVDILGLGHLLDRFPIDLSGGEKQRVAIGRALLSDPQMLLLDEPFSSLDLPRRSELRMFLRHIGEAFKIPMLLVSHDLDDIVQLADDLLVIDQGEIRDRGKMQDGLFGDVMQTMLGLYDDSAVLIGKVTAFDEAYMVASIEIDGDAAGQFPIKLVGRHEINGTRKRLRVMSKDVALAINPPQQTSLQNCLPVKVKHIEDLDNGQMRVTCDCFGKPLHARITRKSCEALDLCEGADVYALLKSVALV